MAKIITVASVKGGVSKSVSAIFLAKILSEKHKVLLIDLDPQNSTTSFFMDSLDQYKDKTILEVLLDQNSVEAMLHQISEGLDFIPADITLANLSIALTTNRDFKLFSVLEKIKQNYDYIVIDTPPSLDIQTRMVLVISNVIIIPTLLEQWSKRAIDILLDYIKTKNIPLQQIVRTELDAVYVLPSLVEPKRTLSQMILAELKEKYQSMVLPGISRRSDVQKLSAIGKDAPIENTLAYKEYKQILKIIKGDK